VRALAACGEFKLRPSEISKQQILERRLAGAHELLPLPHRNKDCGLFAAPRDKLRTFPQTRFQQLAETRLGILHRPALHCIGSCSIR
jgi:hypothetical protein